MPILTESHHVTQALRFLAATNKYCAIGRTTAWADEQNPPAPSASATTVEEVQAYAPLAQATLVIPDEDGLIEFLGDQYTAVAVEDAYTEGAVRVYVVARFEYAVGGLPPLCTFRQVGIFSGLVKAGGAGNGVLLPNEVTSPGILEIIDNRTPTIRAADKVDVICAMVQF